MITHEQNEYLCRTGPGHADGRTAPPSLDSGADGGGTAAAELPAGAGAIARRAADRVPRHPRAARPDGRILRASRRLAVVRAQRGERTALPVPRLEIRRDRAMRRCAVGAGRVGLLPEDQAQGLSVRRDRRRDLGLHGSAGRTAAGAELRMGAPQAVAALHHQALAGEQLAAGDGGRHRFRATCRSCIAAISTPIRCTRTPPARNTRAAPTPCSTFWSRRAAS